jgi:hypothetical protein
MVDFDTFVKRFSKLKPFILKTTKEIVKELEPEIVKMVVDQQLEGINSEGNQMQSGYSKGYTKRRQKRGLQTKYVDLHFTGKMHKGMKVVPVKYASDEEGIDIRSREPYEYYVRANFPKGFSLTQGNAQIAGNLIADRLAIHIKKYLVA